MQLVSKICSWSHSSNVPLLIVVLSTPQKFSKSVFLRRWSVLTSCARLSQAWARLLSSCLQSSISFQTHLSHALHSSCVTIESLLIRSRKSLLDSRLNFQMSGQRSFTVECQSMNISLFWKVLRSLMSLLVHQEEFSLLSRKVTLTSPTSKSSFSMSAIKCSRKLVS